MAKRKKMRKAYLKTRRYSMDPSPFHPVAMRSRGAKAIDLASTPPETWEFGRRGLHKGRAEGPTAVAPHVSNDLHRPTVVPKAVATRAAEVLVAHEQTPFYQKFREFMSQKVFESHKYKILMWFSGNQFIFEKKMVDGTCYRSIEIDTDTAHRWRRFLNDIVWVGKPIRSSE